MHNYTVSMVMSAARPELWQKVYESLRLSVHPYSFELIAAGPYYPTNYFDKVTNFKFIRDFGSPARCFQMAVLLAEGEFLAECADDALFEPDALRQCIELLMFKPCNDVVVLRYCEAPNYDCQLPDDQYWTARFHKDLQLNGIKEHWKTANSFLMRRRLYVEMGGVSTKFEALNLNLHHIMFRIQEIGGELHLSPNLVSKHNWANESSPVRDAYWQNDKQLLTKFYNEQNLVENYISYDNWRFNPPVWKRKEKEYV